MPGFCGMRCGKCLKKNADIHCYSNFHASFINRVKNFSEPFSKAPICEKKSGSFLKIAPLEKSEKD